MSIVIGGLAQFFFYCVAAFAAQNAVFGRSLGITSIVQMVEDPTRDSALFCFLLTLVQVLSAPLCWLANQAMAPLALRSSLRPLVFFAITFVLVLVLVQLVKRLPGGARGEKMAAALPVAAFNTCVLGTLLICAAQSFTLAQSIGFALGSGVGYLVSVLLVSEGMRKMNRRAVPVAFRGLPILLIYIGILALAIYGFTGHGLAI